MPTTPSTINYYIAADGTLRDGQAGSIAQTPRIYYGTEYAVTLSFPPSTIAEGDQLQVAVNRTRTFFSSASATGDAPVAAVTKHEVTAAEADAQAVTLTLSTNTRAMIDQVNGIDHPVRGFFGVHLLRGQSFISLAVADAFMMSVESGPDAISPPLPILDYPTRQEMNDAVTEAQNSASAAKTSEDNADASANAAARDAQAAGNSATAAGNSATIAESYAVGGTGTRPGEDTDNAKYYLEQLGQHETNARAAADEAAAWAEGTPQQVAPYGGENSAKGYATAAAGSASSANTSATQAAGSAGAASRDATAAVTAKNAAETAQGKAETAQGKAETAQTAAETAQGKAEDAQGAAETAQGKAEDAQGAAETAQGAAVSAKGAAETAATNAEKIAEGSDADVSPLGLTHSSKGWAQEAGSIVANKRDILQTLVTSSSASLEVEAGKSYKWTVSAASTISMAAADKVANKETRIDIYIDLQDGGSVTGSGVTIADSVLQSGWYKLIWDGTTATLYSTKAGGAESYITIPASTTAYSLQDNKHYQQVPSAVPTYTLPAVTMDGLVHEITILVDFINVTSCSFVDDGGVPVTLQSAISPQIGEAYVFRCYWYGKWRVVPLKIRNAATATSSTGVVQVSDAVAGDALALKMTAPRSVVVNQMVQGMPSDIITWYKQSVTTTIESDYVVVTKKASGASCGVYKMCTSIWTAGHVYLAFGVVKGVVSPQRVRFQYDGNSDSTSIVLPDTSWQTISKKLTATVNANLFSFYVDTNNNVAVDAVVCYIRQLMLVDLTQYFNGDTALIDSITSWDDLVAYDPRFASYVQYNTGEVMGVQPQVKVTGKNLAQYNSTTFNYDSTKKTQDLNLGLTESIVRKLSNKQITVSYGNPDPNLRLTFFVQGTFSDTQNSYKSLSYSAKGASSASGVLNLDTMTTFLSATMRLYNIDYATGSITPTDVQLELGTTSTAYEPYHDGGTATAPSELFAVGNAADSYEAVSGVTTHKMASVDLGTLEWTIDGADYGGYKRFRAAKPIDAKNNAAGTVGSLICSEFIAGLVTDQSGSDIKPERVNITYNYIFIVTDKYKDMSSTSFATVMSGVYLYYELATPTTSSTTPATLTLQAGDNVAMQTDGGRTLAELAMTYENLPSNE